MSKKPNMKKIGVKYLAIGFCTMLVLVGIGSYVAVSYYSDLCDKNCEYSFRTLCEKTEDSYNEMMALPYSQEEKMDLWLSALQWKVNLMREINDCAISIYDANTHEKIGSEKEKINIVLSVRYGTDEKKTYTLECDYDNMKAAISRYEEECEVLPVDETFGDPTEYTVNLVFDDVYVYGGHFLPGKVALVKNSMFDDGAKTVLAEYDYTPEDISKYQHVIVAGDDSIRIMGPFISKPKAEKVTAVLDSYVAESGNDFWNTYKMTSNAKLWGRYSFYQDKIVLDEDFELTIAMVYDINIFAEHGKWIVIIYVISFLLTVLVSLLLAYRAYMKQRNRYELDQYRRETTNAMAHDLKTPLMTISGCAENLRDNIHTEKKEHYADLILEQVHVMNEMIANILELSKLEQIENLHHKELVDLRKLAEDSWRNCEVLADSKNIDLEIQGECSIQADKNMMTQALDNLMVNAIKYAKADSCICVKLEPTAFEMRNQMDKELDVDADTLWKPFVKGDNSRNEQRGTGIGLSIVKNILDLHGFVLALQCVEKEFVVKITF